MSLAIRSTICRELAASTQSPVSQCFSGVKIVTVVLLAHITTSCSVESVSTRVTEAERAAVSPASVDDLLVVDCLLPGQIRQIGQRAVYVGRRRPIKTTAVDCGIRGGEYVAYDRANYKTARAIWLSDAEKGDAKAQNYLGEIYEKGLGVEPDYKVAASWYRQAAKQDYAAAQINLGKLYEEGRGVPQDMEKALFWYGQAFGLANLQLARELQQAPELPPLSEPQTGSETPPVGVKALEGKIKIEMIDPVVPGTRGIVRIPAEHDISERLIVGRVNASAGLLALTVNDKDIAIESNGMFRTPVPVHESGSKVTIVAVDKAGERAELRFSIKPAESASPPGNFGNYHALVIGNNDYKILPRLQTARFDAESVAEILRRKYGFKVTPLYDANHYQILTTLNQLRKTLTEDDNLLIYYAGHGELDQVNDRGHWLPVDAEPDNTAHWISNVQLTDILNIMSARHILVVADSCYSGTLTRSVLTQLRAGQTDEARTTYIRTVLKKRSRTALTSGGLAPVLDAGGEGHSVFANAFIDSLKSNEEGVLEGQRLFLEVAARVTQAAYDRQFEQVPQYAPIKFTRHEAGDFFFVPVANRAGDLPAVDVSAARASIPGPRVMPGLATSVLTRVSLLLD